MKQAIEGSIERIIFQNEANGYCVLAFSTKEGTITAAGQLPLASKGRRYQMEGEWKNHPRYGMQFAFGSFSELAPDSADSIAAFLSSGVIKGIGPALAESIVRKLGMDTLRIIAEEPERLREVPGIGKAKQDAIVEGYMAHKGYADTVLELGPFGLSPHMCLKLYQRFGTEAASLVRTSPYILIEELDGIGFAKADKIASQLGIPKEHPTRIRYGILAGLNRLMDNGSTFMAEAEFTEELAPILDVDRETISDGIFQLVMDGELIKEDLKGMRIVMLRKIFEAERRVAAKLYALSQAELSHISGNAENMIALSERQSGMSLSDKQKSAVIMAITSGISVITGGPGTGKTTIINTILNILENAGVRTALAAPTGRAAKRMSQASGRDASTIHRLLEAMYSPADQRMYFGKDRDNPLDLDCIIVDEMSMVDIQLMDALLAAVRPGTRLILVGDADQLPSVGPGNVLRDIIESETVNVTKLTEIFRQAEESAIVVNAHAINRGEYPSYSSRSSDFFFMERDDPSEVSDLICELCSTRLPEYYQDLDPLQDIQVLTPTKKDVLGTFALNKRLQDVLNPESPLKPQISFMDRIFRLGDKLIQTKNDYMLGWRNIKDFSTGEGVFNGDIGIVSGVDREAGKLHVLFDDDRLVEYDYSNMEELELAYALTVHKSQGCEFPVVVMPMLKYLRVLTTRNLLYTALTRAKTTVVIVGSKRICNAMVDNNSGSVRNSGLALRLRALWDFDDILMRELRPEPAEEELLMQEEIFEDPF